MSTTEYLEVVEPQPDIVPTLTNSLTIKQKLFIRHYIETRNATQSCRLAGYKGNAGTLKQVASENLAKPSIRAEITRLLNPIAEAEELLARLSKYSRSSMADVLDDSGAFDLAFAKENLADDLIKELKFDKDTGKVVSLKLHDAHEATRDLARFHKLLTDRVETSEELTPESAERLASALISQMRAIHEKETKLVE